MELVGLEVEAFPCRAGGLLGALQGRARNPQLFLGGGGGGLRFDQGHLPLGPGLLPLRHLGPQRGGVGVELLDRALGVELLDFCSCQFCSCQFDVCV